MNEVGEVAGTRIETNKPNVLEEVLDESCGECGGQHDDEEAALDLMFAIACDGARNFGNRYSAADFLERTINRSEKLEVLTEQSHFSPDAISQPSGNLVDGLFAFSAVDDFRLAPTQRSVFFDAWKLVAVVVTLGTLSLATVAVLVPSFAIVGLLTLGAVIGLRLWSSSRVRERYAASATERHILRVATWIGSAIIGWGTTSPVISFKPSDLEKSGVEFGVADPGLIVVGAVVVVVGMFVSAFVAMLRMSA